MCQWHFAYVPLTNNTPRSETSYVVLKILSKIIPVFGVQIYSISKSKPNGFQKPVIKMGTIPIKEALHL